METVTLTETGCYLDSHRGHYISRDAIQLATGYGYIIGGFEKWALDSYDDHSHDENFPNEAIYELADWATEWLNSGQSECQTCSEGSHMLGWPGPGNVWESRTDDRGVLIQGHWVICKVCTGTGRGPRIAGQNFPPIIPKDYFWSFTDGDFGLYNEEEID